EPSRRRARIRDGRVSASVRPPGRGGSPMTPAQRYNRRPARPGSGPACEPATKGEEVVALPFGAVLFGRVELGQRRPISLLDQRLGKLREQVGYVAPLGARD